MTARTRTPLALTRRLLPLAAALLLAAPAQARNLALLVGIGDYRDPGIADLEGPPHDVTALKQVLVQRWGFRPGDIRTLVDRQASRGAILAGLDAVYADSRPGDFVLLYYSGHGTSPEDPLAQGLPLPHGSGALTAWDSARSGPPDQVAATLLLGRSDLKPRLQRLDQGGRRVVVALDACYSANATRGLFATRGVGPTAADLPKRYLPLAVPQGFNLGAHGTGRRPPPPPYPYAHVLTLTAASAAEQSVDIPQAMLRAFPTYDDRPHGAFTDALLRVLSGQTPADGDGDGRLSYRELHTAIDRRLTTGGFRHRPQLEPKATEDGNRLAGRALFDPEATATQGKPDGPPPQAPALTVQLDASAAALAGTLQSLPGVALVDTAPDLRIAQRDGAWLLTNAGGDKIGSVADQDALGARLRQIAWFRQLTRRQAKGPFGLALAASDASQGSVHHPGEVIHFQILPERKTWLVILYVDSDGVVAPLYPANGAEAQPLAAGAKVTMPQDDSLQVTEPLGTDLVVALAYSARPGFLDRLVAHLAHANGPVPFPADSPLYADILASLGDEAGVAVATLELETMPPPVAP